MDRTLQYYDNNSKAYTAETLSADMSSALDIFISYLEKNARILDLGCGSGRDSRYFLQRGFETTAIDGSKEMCRIACQNTSINVRNIRFQDLDNISEFDGIWACASLLHLSIEEIIEVSKLIHKALKDEGVFYSSFKYGTFQGIRDERYYTDLSEDTFSSIILQQGLFTLEKQWKTQDVRNGNTTIWLNSIVRKAKASI